MKKFKNWLFNKKEEVGYVLFPPLINENMLPEKQFELSNGDYARLGIASLEDLDAIIAIQKACYDGEAPWGKIAVSSELRNKNSSFFLMMYHESNAIAFIGISSRLDSFHVTNIATHPHYQKNGIGTFLIETIIEIAQQIEKRKITLEVRTSNINAMNLYRKLGFIDGQIKKNYYHSNGEDALSMFYLVDETGGLND